MLRQIIENTPTWVFILFFILLFYGLNQAMNRQVRPFRVAILPLVMLSLSMAGVLSMPGLRTSGLLSWMTGVVCAQWLGRFMQSSSGVHYSHETKLIYLPGSWLPLALMMVIFIIKYAVGVAVARHLAIVKTASFSISTGFLYGLLSGLFLSRARAIWKVKQRRLDALLN